MRAGSPPLVKRLLSEHRVDVAKVAGTGRDGRITHKDVGEHIAGTGLELLAAADLGSGIRLIGISTHGLEPRATAIEPEQLGLFGATGVGDGSGGKDATRPDGRQRRIETVVDAVRERFGEDALGRAVLVDADGLKTGRAGSLWGPDEED